jgi:hypothetical protein
VQQQVGHVAERRGERRIPVDQKCWCEGDDVTLFGRITNASQRGAFLRTAARLRRGERARLVWNGPGGRRTAVLAEVAWVSDGRSGFEPGLGFHLLEFEDDGAETWAALVGRGDDGGPEG